MPSGGGRSNFRMTPMRPDGKTRQWENWDSNVEIVGCHTGDYAGLNVVDPQPGFEYQWVRNDPTARMLEMQKGGRPVTREDQECPASELGITEVHDGPTPLDTSYQQKDVVLFRYPVERMAERREKEAQLAERMLTGAADSYLHGATPAELATGSGSRTRFARRDHTTQIQDETGGVRRQWTPGRESIED